MVILEDVRIRASQGHGLVSLQASIHSALLFDGQSRIQVPRINSASWREVLDGYSRFDVYLFLYELAPFHAV